MSALKKVDWKRTASAYFWITVGSILYGFAFDWFYTPNLIGYGGITGVGQVVNAFIPAIPIGMFVLVINIPLFILGWKFIGGHLLVTSLYSMVVSSVAVDDHRLSAHGPDAGRGVRRRADRAVPGHHLCQGGHHRRHRSDRPAGEAEAALDFHGEYAAGHRHGGGGAGGCWWPWPSAT